ncbi:Aste57867_23631 [Aphanomyces stellatus]|uniref:Aste57867_23631 protein n=1 Tax=Aphanomyces stellatus TaxID=120398 RepID=A0A485LQ26_9STRA|nr:hypothetical protein As57867_023559 [Aphanomyces stellatus]VFU00276.1 Aste57867_23631 [Aphanomyces stellatus]
MVHHPLGAVAAFHLLIRRGDVQAVESVLADAPHLANAVDVDSVTPIMQCIRAPDDMVEPMMDVLWHHGAAFTRVDGTRLLHLATDAPNRVSPRTLAVVFGLLGQVERNFYWGIHVHLILAMRHLHVELAMELWHAMERNMTPADDVIMSTLVLEAIKTKDEAMAMRVLHAPRPWAWIERFGGMRNEANDEVMRFEVVGWMDAAMQTVNPSVVAVFGEFDYFRPAVFAFAHFQTTTAVHDSGDWRRLCRRYEWAMTWHASRAALLVQRCRVGLPDDFGWLIAGFLFVVTDQAMAGWCDTCNQCRCLDCHHCMRACERRR